MVRDGVSAIDRLFRTIRSAKDIRKVEWTEFEKGVAIIDSFNGQRIDARLAVEALCEFVVHVPITDRLAFDRRLEKALGLVSELTGLSVSDERQLREIEQQLERGTLELQNLRA